MTLDFQGMIEDSHNIQYFNRYIKKIDDIICIDDVIPWELYGIRTPFDLTVNDLNFEIKIQKCPIDRVGLEQFTDCNRKLRGYIHKLVDNAIDIVLFFYPNVNKVLACHAKNLQEWWIDNCNNYNIIKNKVSKDRNGNIWQSSFSYVSLIHIPKNIIWYIDIERKERGLDTWM